MKKLILGILLTISTPTYAGVNATYYADKFVGRRTATGEVYSHHKMTAAYNKMALGTIVKVIHNRTGKFVIVRINDRSGKQGIIDLSRDAAKALGIIQQGVAAITLEKQ